MLNLSIILKSSVPIYLQIADQIEKKILSVELVAGFRLPSVRDLALSLLVNPNTIVKSYQMLQKKNLVESQPGSGFIVVGISLKKAKKRQEELLMESVDQFLRSGMSLGFTESELLVAIKKGLHDLKKKGSV